MLKTAQTWGQPERILGRTSHLLSCCQGIMTHPSWPILHTAQLARLLSVSGAMSTWASHADCKIQQLCPSLASSPFTSTHTGLPCWLSAPTAEVRKALNPRPVQLQAGSLGFSCSSDSPLGLLALFFRMMTAS